MGHKLLILEGFLVNFCDLRRKASEKALVTYVYIESFL